MVQDGFYSMPSLRSLTEYSFNQCTDCPWHDVKLHLSDCQRLNWHRHQVNLMMRVVVPSRAKEMISQRAIEGHRTSSQRWQTEVLGLGWQCRQHEWFCLFPQGSWRCRDSPKVPCGSLWILCDREQDCPFMKTKENPFAPRVSPRFCSHVRWQYASLSDW